MGFIPKSKIEIGFKFFLYFVSLFFLFKLLVFTFDSLPIFFSLSSLFFLFPFYHLFLFSRFFLFLYLWDRTPLVQLGLGVLQLVRAEPGCQTVCGPFRVKTPLLATCVVGYISLTNVLLATASASTRLRSCWRKTF